MFEEMRSNDIDTTTNAIMCSTEGNVVVDTTITPFPISPCPEELMEHEELIRQFGYNWTEQMSFSLMIIDDDDKDDETTMSE